MTSGGSQTSGTVSKSTRHLGVHCRHHPARSSEIARMHQDIDMTIQATQGANVHKPFIISTISVLMGDISLTFTPYKQNKTKPKLHEHLSMTGVCSAESSDPVYGALPNNKKHAFLQSVLKRSVVGSIDFAFIYIFLISELLTMVFFALILHQR